MNAQTDLMSAILNLSIKVQIIPRVNFKFPSMISVASRVKHCKEIDQCNIINLQGQYWLT
jgi:hypothetical protein